MGFSKMEVRSSSHHLPMRFQYEKLSTHQVISARTRTDRPVAVDAVSGLTPVSSRDLYPGEKDLFRHASPVAPYQPSVHPQNCTKC